MRRALRLAMNGRGRVEPNPMVGCIIVSKDGRVIGEGYHQQFGGPHAEPNALAACTESPAGATAYVTLEPCCHANKKTPPCAPRLIEARLGRVVVGCLDPNPEVNGKGVAMLRAAGIRVDGPLLESQAKQLIAPFVARTLHGRPYVTLKWAQSADGKVAGAGGARLQISNARSMRLVHELRGRSDAILVAARTVVNDDPLLTARGVPEARPLTRIVLDSTLSIPLTSRLVATAREFPLVVLASRDVFRTNPSGVEALQRLGVRVEPVNMPGRHFPLDKVLEGIGRAGVTHLLVEPGPTLARSFLAVADRLWVFRSPNSIVDDHAPRAPDIQPYAKTGERNVEGDVLTEYLNPRSPMFFAAEPSADFVLASS
jgi:diaminohydroxyphosphoribosylaminopyrimidine deaminase/5-amino-6-(5-phosphoribosylamino)uracil reductase